MDVFGRPLGADFTPIYLGIGIHVLAWDEYYTQKYIPCLTPPNLDLRRLQIFTTLSTRLAILRVKLFPRIAFNQLISDSFP